MTPFRDRRSLPRLDALEARDVPAAVGALDPSFGTGGVTAVVAGRQFVGLAAQQDGKIVAVSDQGNDFFVTRYNADGTLDTSFGTGGTGVVTVDVGGAAQADHARGVAIDGQNRIVVVGSGGAAVSDFALVRLSPNGQTVELNTHFHVGNGADAAVARAVAFQTDGTIVLAGDAKVGGDRDFALARVNPTTGAVVGTPVTRSFVLADDVANAVAVYQSGPNQNKVVAVGTTGAGDAGLVQVNPNLTSDPTFNGGGGVKILDLGGVADTGRGVAITPTGSVVVTGTVGGGADPDMVVQQLLPTGAFDPTFNGWGGRTLTKTGVDANQGVTVQPDGRIVVVGDSAGSLDVGVFRLNADGSLDSTFGPGGDRTFNVNGNDDGNAVLVEPNGRIVIAGDDAASAGFLARLVGSVEKGRRLATGGNPDATASILTPDPATGQYSGTATTPLTVFSPSTGVVRVAVGDVNGDSVPDVAMVTGPGGPIRFAVLSGVDNATPLIPATAPFAGSEDFAGGGYIAVGDLDNDGRAEVVVTPDQGGGPRVTIFSLRPDGTLATRANFLGIDDANFRGGARAAAGDVNGDGTADLAVAAGFLGGPRVALFDGTTVFATPTRLVNDFFAFPGDDATRLRNGAYVALGDLDGDGMADLIFGGGPGGAPRVFVLSGALVSAGNVAGAYAAPVSNFFVGGFTTDRGGVRVAATDADRDGRAELVTGSAFSTPSGLLVRIYLGKNITGPAEPGTFQNLDPFGVIPGLVIPHTDGVFVG